MKDLTKFIRIHRKFLQFSLLFVSSVCILIYGGITMFNAPYQVEINGRMETFYANFAWGYLILCTGLFFVIFFAMYHYAPP